MNRFFLVRNRAQDKQKGWSAPCNWCAVHDRLFTEPNPEHPGYRRYLQIEAPMHYLDAIKLATDLNKNWSLRHD